MTADQPAWTADLSDPAERDAFLTYFLDASAQQRGDELWDALLRGDTRTARQLQRRCSTRRRTPVTADRRPPLCPQCGSKTSRTRGSIDFTCICGWWTPVEWVYGPTRTYGASQVWMTETNNDGEVIIVGRLGVV